jgi:serine/threonine protein kinase
METLWLVETAELGFPSPEWDEISTEAKDFITQLLHREAFMRPTAAEAMKHPWIAKFVVAPDMPQPRRFSEDATLTSSSGDLRMDSERKSAFQKFLISLKIQKHLTSISESMTRAEVDKLGEVLKQVDQDKDGVIAVEDIDEAVAKGSFSSSLKSSLKEVRSTLASYPKLSINIKPFMKLIERTTTMPSKAKRES